jgi:hypothetical protein
MRRSVTELLTTLTDEKAIAAPEIIGLSNPNMTTGIAAVLLRACLARNHQTRDGDGSQKPLHGRIDLLNTAIGFARLIRISIFESSSSSEIAPRMTEAAGITLGAPLC